MLGSDGEHAVHVRRMAVKMHRNDADRARRDERFDVRDVHAKGVVNVGKDRRRAAMDQRLHGGKRGVRRDDDFVAGLEALRQVHHIDNHRPGRAEHAVLRAGVRGQFGFKRLAFLAQDILARTQGAQRRFLDFGVHETF